MIPFITDAQLAYISARIVAAFREDQNPTQAKQVTKWIAPTDPVLLRRMNKTGEECAELLAVTTRIANQGIDEIDPSSGKTNRQRLLEEIADVYAQLDVTSDDLGLDADFIRERRYEKSRQMAEW